MALRATARRCASSHALFRNSVWPIVATPFGNGADGDEALDLDRFRRSLAFFRAAGCGGATVCGVLGEANRLTDAERAALVAAAVEAAGDMPICVGVSHAGTRATRDLAQMASELGAKVSLAALHV